MVNFACKNISIEEILKCGFNITKNEIQLLKYIINHSNIKITTQFLCKKSNLDITTIQKAVKKLHEKEILNKSQKNLEHGGYIYEYEIKSKEEIRKIILEKVHLWTKKIEDELNEW